MFKLGDIFPLDAVEKPSAAHAKHVVDGGTDTDSFHDALENALKAQPLEITSPKAPRGQYGLVNLIFESDLSANEPPLVDPPIPTLPADASQPSDSMFIGDSSEDNGAIIGSGIPLSTLHMVEDLGQDGIRVPGRQPGGTVETAEMFSLKDDVSKEIEPHGNTHRVWRSTELSSTDTLITKLVPSDQSLTDKETKQISMGENVFPIDRSRTRNDLSGRAFGMAVADHDPARETAIALEPESELERGHAGSEPQRGTDAVLEAPAERPKKQSAIEMARRPWNEQLHGKIESPEPSSPPSMAENASGQSSSSQEGLSEFVVSSTEDASPTRLERSDLAPPKSTLATVEEHVLETFRERLHQIVRGVERDPQGEIRGLRLHLQPDSLGDLDLRIAIEKGVLNAQFVTSSIQVKALIEAALPDLKEQLQQHGITIDELFVGVDSHEPSADQYPTEDNLAHRDYGFNDSPGASAHERQEMTEQEHRGVIDGRIDVLV